MGGCQSRPQQICTICNQRILGQRTNHQCKVRTQTQSNPTITNFRPPPQKQATLSSTNNSTSIAKPAPNPFLPFLKPIFPPPPYPLEQSLYQGQAKAIPNEHMHIKLPTNPERTLFKWSKQPTYFFPLFIKSFRPEIIKTRSFQEKLLWFRLKIEDLRISWQQGCEVLNLDRGRILASSFEGVRKVNLRKELKIRFDDQVVDDAGGLMREWMHLLIKQIFSDKSVLFKQCDTHQTAYKFVWDKSINPKYAKQYLLLLGLVIGKALFDRISINCYLNRTILRQICSQNIFMHDVYSFDKELYKSWNFILNQEGAEGLCLSFSESKTHSDGSSQVLDLVINGRNIEVNDKNKYQYLYEIIQLYCVRSVREMMKTLNEGIYRVVPQQLLSVFEPHQIQMILNGPQTIDVKDWRQNTMYKGYQPTDQHILWFWSIVQKFDQPKLATLLHYCTGSTKVPILGFKYLESNRNTVNKFTIERVKLSKDNPYPKSYTCFNRLELPEYASLGEMEKYLGLVLKEEISHFGLG